MPGPLSTWISLAARTSRPLEPLPVLRGLLELTKPRLSSLVVASAGVGCALAGPLRLDALLITLAGTSLTGGAANAFNQCLEVGSDAQMSRTAARPLPSGRLPLWLAVSFALLLLVAGALLLALRSPLAAGLSLLTTALYALVYTPLKRRTPSCTLVGAVCGALPPLIGWAVATDALSPASWVLFGILFTWQIPHFLAIDWYHRADYARGGHRMLSHLDPTGALSGRQALLWTQALVPISLLAVPMGLGGWLYASGALLLGLAFLHLAVRLGRERTSEAARALFLGSLAYLPLLLGLLALDPTR
jgi:protoheme IX farnesyltransferase